MNAFGMFMLFTSGAISLVSSGFSGIHFVLPCQKGHVYKKKTPLEIISTQGNQECGQHCLKNVMCEAFNERSKMEMNNCELLSLRPDNCTEMDVEDGSFLFVKEGNNCDEEGTLSFDFFACICNEWAYGRHCEERFRDCADYQGMSGTIDGREERYIWPKSSPYPFKVQCDVLRGHSYIQMNEGSCFTGNVNYFDRNWIDFKKGFGVFGCKYWLGLDKVHFITSQATYQMIVFISLVGSGNGWKQAFYKNVSVASEADGYKLHIGGFVNDPNHPAGDSFYNPAIAYESINGQKFTTTDRDNDKSSGNCAEDFKAGFWFNDCSAANLNGAAGGVGQMMWTHNLDKYLLNHASIKLQKTGP